MKIDRINPKKRVDAYGILCQTLSTEMFQNQPMQLVWCDILPGKSTQPHQHFELEKFIIMAGEGEMFIDGEKEAVSEGDVITLPSFSIHALKNTSANKVLTFLSVYSNRICYNKPPSSFHIFSPPPTPNGELHLGHLSGPYFAADVIKRYAQIQGSEVKHIGATDDHQSYVAHQASIEGKTTKTTAADYRKTIALAFQLSDIEYDVFYHPSEDKQYQQFVQHFFTKLWQEKKLKYKFSRMPYCQPCQQYLSEANVKGGCPECKQAITGHCCEACGFVADLAGGVLNPTCHDCQSSAVYKSIKRFFFPLSEYKALLDCYLEGVTKNAKLTNFLAKQLAYDWQDIPVTVPSEWGIDVPVETEQPQSLHVWFEMAAAYCYANQKSKASVAYCFGFDNSFYYTLYNPALNMAFDPKTTLPNTFICNEFYLLEGKKFSTSRRHAIWVNEALRLESADCIRWYLSKTRPERSQQNFSLKAYYIFCESFIQSKLNTWIDDMNHQLKHNAVNLSAYVINSQLQKTFFRRLVGYVNDAEQYYGLDNFSLNSIAQILEQLLEDAKTFTAYQIQLPLSLTALKVFASIALPIMPKFCRNLLSCFEDQAPVWPSDLQCVSKRPTKIFPHLHIKNSMCMPV